ncbi:MAG: hypothetical protein K2Y20_08960 [Sphingomonas sp.]|nr:hypothetical protein [Sphingomonas sp.]
MLSRFFSKPKSMVLEGQGFSPIREPSEQQVRYSVLALKNGGSSFLSVTDELGNYIQIAGSRPWCFIEHRQIKPLNHSRAYRDTPVPKYEDGAKIHTGAGDIELMHDEWFLLKDAAEIAVGFLKGESFPKGVNWRSLNEMLGI